MRTRCVLCARLFFFSILWYTTSAMNRGTFLLSALLVPVAFVSLSLTSCSGTQGISPTDLPQETLRVISARRSDAALWTGELEKTRLSDPVAHLSGLAPSVEPSLYSAAVMVPAALVMPSLSDFGSLDLSSLPASVRTAVDGFCRLVLAGEDARSYMAEGMLFSLVLFYADVRQYGRQLFSADIPTPLAAESVPRPFFSAYIIGAPYAGEEDMEVPVRFLCADGYIDCALFVTMHDEPQIQQIRITGGKRNGKD